MRLFTWASYGMYFLGGMAGVLFGAVMPELLKHYHATYTTGGIIVLLQAIGFMTGVPVVSFLMIRYHYKYVLAMSALAVTIAQFFILLLPPLGWVFGLAAVNGFGTSALETAVASYVMELFVGQRAVVMSRLEVAFGLGALCMPAIASALIALHVWRFAFCVTSLLALCLAALWFRVSFSLADGGGVEQLDARTSAPPMFPTRLSKFGIMSFFLFLIFVYVGLEGSLNGFLPSVFTTYLHALPYYASLSVSTFWVAMVCGRVAIGWVARHVNYERYLMWSITVSLAFLIWISLVHSQWLCFVVIFGLGLAMSPIYSITMVYANHTFPGLERVVTSLVTAFAGVGGAVFPFITGFAMDRLRTNDILWMFVGFCLLMLFALLVILASLGRLRGRSDVSAVSVDG